MHPQSIHDLKEEARRIGFDGIGFASIDLPQTHTDFYQQWIQKKFHASMGWMENEKRLDPRKILPSARSMICCAISYYRGKPFSQTRSKNEGWISNYAWGDDYHEVVKEKLQQLEAYLHSQFPGVETKSYVDTGAILERSYATQAGLGWIGKNTLLIHHQKGSFLFLGEILTNLELPFDTPGIDHCGKCTRCLDACPTQALTPYELDANRCISYLTLEHKGEIEEPLQSKIGSHLVGCDICQEVCPWNQEIPMGNEPAFEPRPGNFAPVIEDSQLTPEKFSERFRKSPVKRLKYAGWQRNVELAKRNSNGS